MALITFFKHQKNVQKLPIKYLDKKIIAPNAQPLISQLNYIMTEQQLYKDANLTLPILAKKLTISTQHLSQLLNDNLKKSFSFYVNEFRIQAAKQLLTGKKAMKMDDIAQQSGFNSQSTFYTAFKKISHTTPAKYRDSKI
jgi:YesN/AraC family two-component response regulator